MPRSTTPSFIFELPLVTTQADERELDARFNAGLRLYYACLNEAEVRRKLMQNSEAYQAANAIRPKTVVAISGKKNGQSVPNPERVKAFADCRKQFRYTEFDLHNYSTIVANRSKWIAEKLDSNTQQKLATRAFRASEKVCFGKAKKVRFKGFNRFRSMEGKTNKQGIRLKGMQFVWGCLKLDVLLDMTDPVAQHVFSCPIHDRSDDKRIKYCRILRKEINGKDRFFVQLIVEGLPYAKPKNYVRSGEVGTDLNVSNVAFASAEGAGLEPLAENVPSYEKEIKRLQRKMERSKRIANPDNYEPDFKARRGQRTVNKKGKVKKGKRKWNNSKNYYRLAAKKRNLERRKSAYAKSQNRRIVNEILRHGSTVKTEKVTVKTWQKRWGKAISAKCPGFLQSELNRKAESAGGKVIKFKTQTTACSQTHLDGERRKKTLSERVHKDVTGPLMHRDLFSAFLSLNVLDDSLPSAEVLQEQYRRMEPCLSQAWERYESKARSK